MRGPVTVDLTGLTEHERAWLAARDEFRVLVLGKTGVGKSTLINAAVNANAAIGKLEVGTTQVSCYENTLNDEHSVAVFDAPGFFDVEGRTPAGVLRELSANVDDYHAVVYAHPSTDRRLRLEDEQSISFVVLALGAAVARRTVVALTYANELPGGDEAGGDEAAKAEVIETRGRQVGELFEAAQQMVGTSTKGEPAVPCIAVGQAGDGTGWESALWVALVRRAKEAADAAAAYADGAGIRRGGSDVEGVDLTAQAFDVDWDGLRAAGVVTEDRPARPPPPLELVRAYVAAALGEFDNGEQTSGSGAKVNAVHESVFTVKQRGMPSGFAATVILEVSGPLESSDSGTIKNRVCMLMPGAAANTVMKVAMGSIPSADMPSLAALRRGSAEVTVGALPTFAGGAGPVTYTFDQSDGSFTSSDERLTAGRLVKIVESRDGDEASAAVVLTRKTTNAET